MGSWVLKEDELLSFNMLMSQKFSLSNSIVVVFRMKKILWESCKEYTNGAKSPVLRWLDYELSCCLWVASRDSTGLVESANTTFFIGCGEVSHIYAWITRGEDNCPVVPLGRDSLHDVKIFLGISGSGRLLIIVEAGRMGQLSHDWPLIKMIIGTHKHPQRISHDTRRNHILAARLRKEGIHSWPVKWEVSWSFKTYGSQFSWGRSILANHGPGESRFGRL